MADVLDRASRHLSELKRGNRRDPIIRDKTIPLLEELIHDMEAQRSRIDRIEQASDVTEGSK